MRFISTRGQAESVDFAATLTQGLAPDGGLYVPEAVPHLEVGWQEWSYTEALTHSLELFGALDVRWLVEAAAGQFTHRDIAPIVEVDDRLVFELFHGPTLSFKDHAMQVLGRLLTREVGEGTVLGATSGDTGSAAISALRGTDINVVILFPDGLVSEFQRRQMTTVPDANITVVAVRGTFDDCQALVKQAFESHDLLAINSINWARIAAQVGYYIHAAAQINRPFDVVVPTGNFGNAFSCLTAKTMGVPIETITLANNSNHRLADLVTTGDPSDGNVVATVAPSMDVQVPSNLERFTGDPSVAFSAGWSTDDQIRETIGVVADARGYVMDTHTATAWRAGAATKTDRPQLVVSTAHPAKFSDVVADAIGWPPAVPKGFENLAELEERIVTIDPDPLALSTLLR